MTSRTRPRPPRIHFFGGKGGVGKTTCASAFALGRARAGERVLLVSTDPAHSLQDALGKPLGTAPRKISERLRAVQPEGPRAFSRWLSGNRETLKRIAERGTYFDAEDLDGFLDLSLPGLDELFGLLELLRLIEEEDADTVVVDTAPTGHTLRLFATPGTLDQVARLFSAMQEKHHVIAEGLRGFRRGDDADALIDWIDERARRLDALLRDRERTCVHWIALPEAMPLEEAADGISALREAGISVDELIVNRITPAPKGRCDACRARVQAEGSALAERRRSLDGLPLRAVPSAWPEPVGTKALVAFARHLDGAPAPLPKARRGKKRTRAGAKRAPLEPVALQVPASTEVLFFGGKGGVGKTTASVAAALDLARRYPERPVLLLSVDPAHSLADALGHAIGDVAVHVPGTPPNLTVRELDAPRALARERERLENAVEQLFDKLRGDSRFDAAYDRTILHELTAFDPPGVDEIFGVLEVVDALGLGSTAHSGPRPLVVIDTAPTGHALRLLELPAIAHGWVKGLLKLLLKYRGAVGLGTLAEDLLRLSKELGALQALWTDPARTAFVSVTRAAALPVDETARLWRALAKLRVPRTAVLVNALTTGSCARCQHAARAEQRALGQLRRLAGRRAAIITAPAIAPPPRGPEAIRSWSQLWDAR